MLMRFHLVWANHYLHFRPFRRAAFASVLVLIVFVFSPHNVNAQSASTSRAAINTNLLKDAKNLVITDFYVTSYVTGNGVGARGQAVVTWRTNQPTTSLVEYAKGTFVADFNQRTIEDPSYALDHTMTIYDLTPSTVYSFRAISHTASGALANSQVMPVVTDRAPVSILEIVITSLRKLFGF